MFRRWCLLLVLGAVLLTALWGCAWLEHLWKPPVDLTDLTIQPRYADVKPGETILFQVGKWECCYFFEAIPAHVVWSVQPRTAGRMTPGGTFEVALDAQPGLEILIRAQVDDRLQLEARAVVYTPEANPLVGYWYEEQQILCSGRMRDAPQPFEELVFHADNTFTLTWLPFELYIDYGGTYVYDPDARSLHFSITWGNYVPEKTDLEGVAVVENPDSVRLEGLFLGLHANSEDPTVACGHLLRRRTGFIPLGTGSRPHTEEAPYWAHP